MENIESGHWIGDLFQAINLLLIIAFIFGAIYLFWKLIGVLKVIKKCCEIYIQKHEN